MGFVTGFTGGVTLTLGVAYLTVLAHERNRQAQAAALRSQSRVLTGLVEPSPVPPPQSRAELAREERSTLVETAKDRWNDEVENAIRWVQRTDWNDVRERMEGSVARLLGCGLQKSREGIEEVEKQAGPKVQEAVDRSRAATKKATDQAAVGIDRASRATVAGAEKAGVEAREGAKRIAESTKVNADKAVASTKDKPDQVGAKTAEYGSVAKSKADRAAADVETGAHEAAESIRNSGGTVNAARGAIRDMVNKSIEKGKEALDKAQTAVGLATEKMESRAQSTTLSHSSAVEKALHERYEKPDPLSKTVDEVLEDRYKPIDARDNTVLRGF